MLSQLRITLQFEFAPFFPDPDNRNDPGKQECAKKTGPPSDVSPDACRSISNDTPKSFRTLRAF